MFDIFYLLLFQTFSTLRSAAVLETVTVKRTAMKVGLSASAAKITLERAATYTVEVSCRD